VVQQLRGMSLLWGRINVMFARSEFEKAGGKVAQAVLLPAWPFGVARGLRFCFRHTGFAFALLSGPVQSAAGVSFCPSQLAGSF